VRVSSDGGSVTAETAVALPALVLVAVLAAWLLAAVAAEIRCVDAARIGARALARGESTSAAVAAVARAAPRGADVAVTSAGGELTVEVRTVVGPALGGRALVRVGASAAAPREELLAPHLAPAERHLSAPGGGRGNARSP
jgi:hypothetical protein